MDDFLGTETGAGGVRFALGEHLHGAFGGVFGGAVAAATLRAARTEAAGRRPFSLHVSFLRGLATPTCTATATVVAAGRTVTTVAVDLVDAGGRPAARATAAFAVPDALAAIDAGGGIVAPALSDYADGPPMGRSSSYAAPIVDVLAPRLVGSPDGGYAQAVQLPWDPDPGAGAEAVCLAADFCVGMPVAVALGDRFVAMPNPDLSLRFVEAEAVPVLVGVGRVGRIAGGVAATAVEVWAGPALAATGVSSAVLLGGAGP